jgi:nucleoside phosphorylase
MDSPSLEHKDYTIGWICGQGLETTTARAVLDEEYEDLPQSSSDTNDYILGRIGGHNVVVVGLPPEEPWTTSAAVAVTQMSFTFPNVRHRLVVGRGSGVPSERNDIRLGDVVVSSPGGIVQWDLGKFGSRGSFTRRCDVFQKPPTTWRNAIAKFRSTLELANLDISQYLTQLAKTNSRLPAYCEPPPPEDDMLFDARYDHCGESSCTRCDKSAIVQRFSRSNFGPVVHYGLVATGGSLIRDTALRDRLSHELGHPLGFETFSSGLVNNFPCICILGISNYADSHTNARYSGTAVAMATILARELLGFVPMRYDQDGMTLLRSQAGKKLT